MIMLRIGHINFNPRSHERSDRYHSYIHFFFSSISIHAPTRGATFVVRHFAFVIAISIHAPTRGATVPGIEAGSLDIISIHAPTRGATTIKDTADGAMQFQSTLPREERPILRHSSKGFCLFQSTLPREERRCKLNCCLCLSEYFNPRSHEMSDPYMFHTLYT